MDFVGKIWGKSDLELIGSGIKYLGPKHWQPGMLFVGTPDAVFRDITKGFPQRLKGRGLRHTHPIFVLEANNDLAHRVCPCSSKKFPETIKYIPAGCVLDYTKKVTTRTSYLVTEHSFLIPTDADWLVRLRFIGRVPRECVKSLPGSKNRQS